MIIKSILDTDLYKLTMGQAIAQKFPHAKAQYKFINRGGTKFLRSTARELKQEIQNMASLKLSANEKDWLRANCSYFNPVYLDFLAGYKYDPSEVDVRFYSTSSEDDGSDMALGDIDITITGPWYRTVYWEVPLMAIVSELYNRNSKQPSYCDIETVVEKSKTLTSNECFFADFGTRRRFSQQHHDKVVKTLDKQMGTFVGTSNVHLAMQYQVKPIGTQAHEWFMFHGAKYGYREANRIALKNWVDVYHGSLGIALTDTFGTDDFFKSFGSKYSKLFDGIRHDSGDWNTFAKTTIAHYLKKNINPNTKTIVFSDGLNVKKVLEINKAYDRRIKCSYGIGTNLTNDIKDGAKPLNMVIKMTSCKPYEEHNWLPVVKLSDDKGKHTGASEEIELCKKTLRL